MGLFYILVVLIMPRGVLRFAGDLLRGWRGRPGPTRAATAGGPAGLTG
jgi:hypothetical protein